MNHLKKIISGIFIFTLLCGAVACPEQGIDLTNLIEYQEALVENERQLLLELDKYNLLNAIPDEIRSNNYRKKLQNCRATMQDLERNRAHLKYRIEALKWVMVTGNSVI